MTPTESWTSVEGVIEMPDGTRIRGRGLRRPLPAGEQPNFGVYLSPAAAAVRYVRDRYDRHAVETPFQRRFVRQFQRYT